MTTKEMLKEQMQKYMREYDHYSRIGDEEGKSIADKKIKECCNLLARIDLFGWE